MAWYVMQVTTGSEEKIVQQCSKLIPKETLTKAFIPLYKEQRKLHGKRIILNRRLFPGYVFLDSNDIVGVMPWLQQVIGLTKILKTSDKIIPLTQEECRFIREFGGEDGIVELSEIWSDGKIVEILNGPLKGREALIKKIDWHKCRVHLEMEMFGRIQAVTVGFEFVTRDGTGPCKNVV